MLSNWCKGTTTTTGTGTITLASVTGRPLPSAAHAIGEYVQYSINTSDGKFESGIGQIGASETLARSTVTATWDGTTYDATSGTPLTLSGGPDDVFVTPIAAVLQSAAKYPLTNSTAVYSTNRAVVSAHLIYSEATTPLPRAQSQIAYPFELKTSGILTGFQVKVLTAQAGHTLILGLYEQTTDGTPGRLLAKTSSPIDVSTTGIKTQTLSGSNIRLSPGFYWIGECDPVSGTPCSLSGASSRTATAMGIINNPLPLNYIQCTTVDTDLSDPFPTTSLAIYLAGNAPYIGLLLS